MRSPKEELIRVAALLFERKLTDMAGGNLSIRDGDTIYLSPRFAGSQLNWQLSPDDIICGSVSSDELFQNPRFSREGKAHLGVYRRFPEVTGCVHAHPFHVLPFCVAERPIEPVLESTQKFGVIEVVKGAPAHSQELADQIVAAMERRQDSIRKQAGVVLLPRHGIFAAGKDILAAFDAVERIDWQAYCILAQGMMPATPIGYVPLEGR